MIKWTRTIPVPALALLLLAPVAATADRGEKASRQENRDISLDGADRLALHLGAGYLKIHGEDSRSEIRMEATVIAHARDAGRAAEILQDVEIRESRGASTLTLKTRGPQNLNRGGFRVDMTLWVPADLELEISDGSGDIEVSGMRNGLAVDDGSGDLDIQSLEGYLRVNDGSGDIRIRDVDATAGSRGHDDIHINDGSGGIEIDQVRGELSINDGSGEIRIDGLTGSLELNDGSGDIEIAAVQGSAEIRDGSGDLDIRDVQGDVEVSDGSGNIRVDRIGGNFRIEDDGSGSLQIGEVSGSVLKPR